MVHAKIFRSPLMMALALAGATACGSGSNNNPPPQTPADQTTTTGAMPTDQNAQPPSTTQGTAPSTQDVAPSSGSATPNGPMNGSPMNGTAGTAPNGSPSSSPTTGDQTGTPGATDTTALTDGQIVLVVQTADHGEIDQAREALHKAKRANVKQFAQHMLTDHSAADTKIAALDSKVGIAPQGSPIADQLKTSGEQIMSNLKSASGSDFDKAYIDAQVNEHTTVLDLLDNKLIPRAQNPDLVKTLQEIRSKVANHLKMAQGIQSSLGNQ
jgi:putative membrane protein